MKNENGGAEGTIEVIVIELYTNEDKTPPEGKHYEVKIDGKPYVFHHHEVTGKEIQEKAGKLPIECFGLFEKKKHHEYKKIEPEQKVNLIKHAIEHFKTEPPEKFCFKIDDIECHTHHHELTSVELLEITKKFIPVDDYYLIYIRPDGKSENLKDRRNEKLKMVCPCMIFTAVYTGPSTLS